MAKSDDIEVLDLNLFRKTNILPDFYINTMADHLVTSHAHIERPHRHDFYVAILFVKGSGTHTIDFTTYDVKPGSVFVMSPGQMHHWQLSQDADGYIFCHTKSFYEMRYADESLSDYAFFSQVQNVGCIEIDASRIDEFANHFQKMSDGNFNDAKAYRHFVISHITQVYLELECALHGKNLESGLGSAGYLFKFKKFEELLEQGFRSEKSPEKYAEKLNMTAKHLNRINRQIVGKSTSDIIMERVMLEAKRLLIHSEESFNAIAFGLGYDDYAYFSKLFKKKTGTTPSEFQRNQR
ncbi:helix-turn-helix domain-containing protein [Flavobacterium sp. MAH-1]|uniref:Helix-turn-helix domain-containing protein n=1 Tax=Flavobacterium agri TaxID=2743471 RepID=A0A7Y9C5X1_9FLAO|nr:helix-turn-helix transcriptional regulator [Flavobacterium agri]NUY81406.1 helix-turn-helix domain-containing protein [Flavobacterium agri]NYA71430.1 helix-turn-helix domain-containing protein [Flavobacterium agri]